MKMYVTFTTAKNYTIENPYFQLIVRLDVL
jgi:hypothetical protein